MSPRRCTKVFAAWFLAAMLLPLPAGHALPQGGEEGAGQSGLAVREFTIRHRGVDDAYVLISPALGPLGSVRAQPHQKTLTVTDAPGNIVRIAALLAAFDVPPRSVEVAVQLILASAGPPAPGPVPPPIRGVIEKLSALSTRWTDYRLVGNARVLGTEGERTRVMVGDDYRIDFGVDEVSDDARIIRLKPFALQRRELPVEGNERYASVLDTVLNLRDSQLFIVGASRTERSNKALFLTVTASLQRP